MPLQLEFKTTFLLKIIHIISSEKGECHLSSSTRVSGSLASIPGWSYFDRNTVNCSKDGPYFKCPNETCISLMKICDNHNDCDDHSDERDCESKLDFQIRLAGSENKYEGRIEVKGKMEQTFIMAYCFRIDFFFLGN